MPNIPYSWAAVITLTILLGLAGLEIRHEISKNTELSTSLEAANETIKQTKELQTAVTTIDQSQQARTNEIKADQTKLDRAVATRTIILRVPAVCAPAASATTSQPDDQRPELDPSARSDYYAIRTGIMEREAKIEGLQQYIGKVCLKL